MPLDLISKVPEDKGIAIYEDARKYYSRLLKNPSLNTPERWQRVTNLFGKVVKEYPKSSRADDSQYLIGLCYQKQKKVQEALEAFSLVDKNYPESSLADDSQYMIGKIYLQQNNYKSAVDAYMKITEAYPKGDMYKKTLEKLFNLFQENKDGENANKMAAILNKQGRETGFESRFRIIAEKYVKPEKTQVIDKSNEPAEVSDTQKTAEADSTKIAEPTASGTQLLETTLFLESPASSFDLEGEGKDWLRIQGEKGVQILKELKIWSAEEATRLVTELKNPGKYEVHRLKNPERVYIDFVKGIVYNRDFSAKVNDGLIADIKVSQFDRATARLVIGTDDELDYRIFALENPDRVVLDLFKKGNEVKPVKETAPDTTRSKAIEEIKYRSSDMHAHSLIRELGLTVKSIVIDAGHGGSDPGAIGPGGVKEKDITLDIAMKLKELLSKDPSYEIYLTRETDVFIPLEQRPTFANQKGADLFISIHINSHKLKSKTGIETYYLSPSRDKESMAVAAFENATAKKNFHDLTGILEKIAKTGKITESHEFAKIMHGKLISKLKQPDRKIRNAAFIVLVGTTMPAILVETGFISNSADVKRLKSPSYRLKVAQAILDGIESYSESVSMLATK